MKGERLKFARKLAEKRLGELKEETKGEIPGLLSTVAAQRMAEVSGLPHADCLKFIKQGRW